MTKRKAVTYLNSMRRAARSNHSPFLSHEAATKHTQEKNRQAQQNTNIIQSRLELQGMRASISYGMHQTQPKGPPRLLQPVRSSILQHKMTQSHQL